MGNYNNNYNKNKNKFLGRLVLLLILLLILLARDYLPLDIPFLDSEETKQVEVVAKDSNITSQPIAEEDSQWLQSTIERLGLQNHKEIQVDGGDVSGYRELNVKVNIGFGPDREYWGFTNEYGQLVYVLAENIIPQDDDTEPVNSKGRYYSRMADVPGTENKEYDRGHVIADSLGGVSNAYNITPQQFYLNRHGDQAYMEKVIRDAGGASNMLATISYEDTETQIPQHYKFEYILKGNEIIDSFPNKDPREG